MAIVNSYISGKRRTLILNTNVDYESVLKFLEQKEGTCEDVLLCSQGKVLDHNSIIGKNSTLIATLKLCGGKGGFGSMLRAIGAQIEKTTNREACRDLSGRRLRDINEEKRVKEYLQNKKDKQKEREEKRKQKMEKLKETPKHLFEDKSYAEQRDKREKDIYESVDKALTAGSSKKRKCSEPVPQIKKKKMHFELDFDVSSDDSSDDENIDHSNCETQSKESSAKPKTTKKSEVPNVSSAQQKN